VGRRVSTLIDRIAQAMATDTESRVKQSDYLRLAYTTAGPAARTALDAAFIALCGYSLTTLLARGDTIDDG
jgi:hypothetical protein